MEEPGKEEEDKLTEINISNIEKDTERLKLAKQLTAELEVNDLPNENPDDDNLSKYTSETEKGVKVLDSTTNINRKAIFHDLGRIKSWRESLDKPRDGDDRALSPESPIIEENTSIMEQNIATVLGELPDVNGGDDGISHGAARRLTELENKINRKHTLSGKNT